MVFPQHFIDQVKQRACLRSIISQDIKLQKKGQEYMGFCPFHKEKTPSFFVSPQKNVYHCFGCKVSGNIFDYLKHRHSMEFHRAVIFLAQQYGLNIPKPEAAHKSTHHLDILHSAMVFFQECLYHQDTGRNARSYLQERGLSPAAWEQFSLGYAPCSRDFMQWAKNLSQDDLIATGLLSKNSLRPLFTNRLIFPIHDKYGKPMGFGGRCLDGRIPKYLNSPETEFFLKKTILYGISLLRYGKEKHIILVEGYMDAISLWSKGIPGVVAPLGTAISSHHMDHVWSYHPAPIVCFDGDEAGRRSALRSCKALLPLMTADRSLRIALMPSGHDPDSFVQSVGPEKFLDLCANSIPLHLFLYRMTVSQYGNIKHLAPEQQAKVRQELIDYTHTMTHYGLKSMYKNFFYKQFYEDLRGHRTDTLIQCTVQRDQWIKRGERILLATLYHYPALLEEKIAVLEAYTFLDKEAQNIAHRFLQCFPSYSETPMHVEELLDDKEIRLLKDETLSVHAYFLTKPSPLNDVSQAWDSLAVSLNVLPQIKHDLHTAAASFGQDMDKKGWKKIKSIHGAVHELKLTCHRHAPKKV